MASLNLRLEKKYLDADVNLGVVARVQQTEGPGSASAEPLEVVIPAGQYNSKRVEVPAGTYQIEARLPSGEVLRERREVGANEDVDVVFQAGQSPHEWRAGPSLVSSSTSVCQAPMVDRYRSAATRDKSC